ncbi:MAG: hypothetical protein ABR970_18780 [Roseiarcus sp.]|jgi:anti-sigma factor RsiW
MTGNAEPEDERAAIEELLPWYAAGRLDASRARRVEEALAREPKLRESLRAAREERDQTIGLNEGLGAPGARAWARVLAATAAEPRRPTLRAQLRAALSGRGVNRAGLAWAGAAAALVIVLQGAAIVALLPRIGTTGYESATQAPPAAEGTTALVTFAPDATMREVEEVLRRLGDRLIDGPLAGGLFRVRIGDAAMTFAARDAALASLRAEPVVATALPAPRR